jgi:nucleotide-binding universal stress UspA family protein
VIEFKQILYPTDISEASLPALPYAVSLARWYGARLTVLHVVPTFDPMQIRPGRLEDPAQIVQPPTRDEVLGVMQQSIEAGTPADVELVLSAEAGDAAGVIIDQALTIPADLLVMGTHGRSGFDHLLFGSVTEKVMRRAPCPVLTVPPHARPADAGEVAFRRILCAIDFSPGSLQALGCALDLARRASGAVTVLYAIDVLAEEEPAVSPDRLHLDEYRQQLVADAQARLDELLAAERATCDIHDVVALGRADREVLRMAEEAGADVIVMGAQGRGGIGLALFGSTTQQVLRAANCPVLIARLVEPTVEIKTGAPPG